MNGTIDEKAEKATVQFFLPVDLTKRIKHEAIEANCKASQIAEIAIREYLDRQAASR